jgi:hypothetical protein
VDQVKKLIDRLWREPALVVAVIVGAINAGLFLPDWRAALASVAVSLAGGGVVRSQVTPIA